MKFCTSCGAENAGKPFCTSCGKPMPAAESVTASTAAAPEPEPVEVTTRLRPIDGTAYVVPAPPVGAEPVGEAAGLRAGGPFWTRARVVLAALVAALLVGGVAGGVVLLGGKDKAHPQAKPTPSAAPTSPVASAAPSATTAAATAATVEVKVDPFTPDGKVSSSYTVVDESSTLDCYGTSAYETVPGTFDCGDMASNGRACWADPEEAGHILCIFDPWSGQLHRFAATGLDRSTAANDAAPPFALELADGSQCSFRSGGTGESPEGLAAAYYCLHGSVSQILAAPGDPEVFAIDDHGTWRAKGNHSTEAPRDVVVTKVYWMSGPKQPVAPAVQRNCWDGSRVPAEGTCVVDSLGAELWATGFSRSDCDAAPTFGEDHNVDSYYCYRGGDRGGVKFHVARYDGTAGRQRQLDKYGHCSLEAGGLASCAPGPTLPRRVRTYRGSTGIMIYVSVDAADGDALAGLHLRTADELLRGVPVD